MKKSNSVLNVIFILTCSFLMFLACSENTAKMSNSLSVIMETRHQNNSLGTTSIQNDQTTDLSCNNFRDLKIQNDDIEIPQSVGQYVENCHENPNYNACIYHYDPFIRDGSLIPEFKEIFETRISLVQAVSDGRARNNLVRWSEDLNDYERRFNEAMRFYQNYAVNITGTTDGFLKNEHYNVIAMENLIIGSIIRGERQPNGKWTTPYFSNDELFEMAPVEPTRIYIVRQVMVYYYLMYQKEWMELNTGQWYASGKNISVDFTGFTQDKWIKDRNQIALTLRTLENESSPLIGVNFPSFNAFSPVHEAAHANFYYSNPSREDSEGTHKECGIISTDSCCVSKDGCFNAINEGQSDFNTFMLFPNVPIGFFVGDFINREALEERGESIQSPSFDSSRGCRILRDHRANKNLTSEEAFNCDTVGEIHNMGALYASIWWEIYDREDTSKRDIATLFTEHLPLISNDDTFRTVASKIINKARELFDGPKGEHYACIISQEFTRRGLTPLTPAVE